MGEAEPTPFAEVWRETVRRRSPHTFLRFEDSRGRTSTWTYGEFDRLVARTAAFLAASGVGRGDAVHLALANSPAFVAIWIASVRLGAWIVPSDPHGGTRELESAVKRTRTVVGFCGRDRARVYRESVGGLGRTPIVVEVDEDDAVLSGFGSDELAAWPEVEPTDRAAVMFTSGTTGTPKGVEVTQANYAFAGETMAAASGLEEDDRQLVVLPMFHANAQYYSFASAIHAGASVALMSTFSASGFLPQAARHGATAASLFAAPLRMILARGGPEPGVRLRHCWFAQNITREQYATVAEWFGCRPRQLYGMTETIPAVLTDDADDPDPSSMGRVTAGCQVRLSAAEGREAEPGEVGELEVAGKPGVTIFAGYLDDPDTTRASFRDGWFRTGDRATRDSEGRFHFEGRGSEILKVAGENVSTVEIEAVLAEHPSVLEAAVVGRPDDVRDEVPVAFVVGVQGAAPGLDELDRWCDERLAPAKRPRAITVLDMLPRTSVGKIRKFELMEDEHR